MLVALGATTLFVLNGRYRQVHQNASWQESLLLAEAGIDMAINELRKGLYDPQVAWAGWTTGQALEQPNGNPADPSTSPLYYTSNVIIRQGEGGQRSWTKVSVDGPSSLLDSRGEQWYRVRSLGVAELSGGSVVAGDKTDLGFRKFDLRFDHRTGAAVATPQATRMIEAVIKPVGAFRTALFGVSTVDLNDRNIVVDSYDSRDPAKSTNNFYDPAKRQENGHIATNGQIIDAGDAFIYGDVSTNGGTIFNPDNVTGEIRTDFYQEVFAVRPPNVTADAGTPTQIIGDAIIDAQADVPSQFRFSQIQLPGEGVLRIRGAADGSPTYAQIVVTGDISVVGLGQIVLDPGVYVRIFVGGDTDLTGNGVLNPNSPLNLQIYGLDRPVNPDGSPQFPGSMKISGNGGFRGTVYAPNYNVELLGGGTDDSLYGAFIGLTVRMTGVQSVHYDEALGDGGLISDYKVVSWFEDTH
jgi:hypothetical protein